ncbi:glycosyltransferase family 39 protein [Nocardia blacklockiae]|nr:glycosyltransferase family 39 protein [Nocardia blacklockiae]
MANGFYAAAAWSGSRDWQALLFGSLDPGDFITVDKPPVSQWVMGLSGQLFGFGSASMLVPQALMAVATVALLYGAVTRVTGSRGAGLLAGLVFAVTPVAALMFRFDNPDAVMVLLMTAGAYCVIRALPRADVRWLVTAGAALGFAFLAKMLEGLMVLPALVPVYLLAAPTTVGKRLLHLASAAAALVVAAGWYVVLTLLWPASERPYLAGSKDNTFMDLVLGYNGFERVLGRNHQGRKPFELPAGYEMPHPGGAGPGGFGAGAGPTRMFTGEIGFEISWLLPAAAVAFVLVLVSRWRAPRTDAVRAAALVFGLWLLVDAAAFSTMKGGMHAYYTLAIAPAVAGGFALGVHEVWLRRETAFGRIGGAALILAGGVWTFVVLQRNGAWQPWLRWVILVAAVVAAAGLLAALAPVAARRVPRRAVGALLTAGVFASLAGSSAYAAATLPQPHTGGSPSVGPARAHSGGPAVPSGVMGAFRGDGKVDPRLVPMLRATTTKWSAAIDRSSPAAELELASRTAVIAIGGFTSADPTPTLPRFQALVRDHQLTYYLAPEVRLPDSWRTAPADSGSPQGDSGQGWWHPVGDTEIYDWVSQHYTGEHLDGMVVYDLTVAPH